MSENELVEQAAGELYGLPPGEFTRARDERAKEVRSGGDREAANAVKALRKPTVAAWALNQLSRRRGKDLDALLEAGEKLRAAQEELVGGGDRSGFQQAASRERELVAKLAGDATTLASEAGERGAGLQEKIAATLHAAALDDSVADELRAGRLTREREAIGGFGAAGAMPAAEPPTTGRSKAAKSAPAPAKSGKRASPRKTGKRATPPKADPRAAERRQRLSVARTDERHAQRELDAAERAVQHAEERAEAAAAHAQEAEERARKTADRLKEAKRAQTAARKAHARAQRALEKAEQADS